MAGWLVDLFTRCSSSFVPVFLCAAVLQWSKDSLFLIILLGAFFLFHLKNFFSKSSLISANGFRKVRIRYDQEKFHRGLFTFILFLLAGSYWDLTVFLLDWEGWLFIFLLYLYFLNRKFLKEFDVFLFKKVIHLS